MEGGAVEGGAREGGALEGGAREGRSRKVEITYAHIGLNMPSLAEFCWVLKDLFNSVLLCMASSVC